MDTTPVTLYGRLNNTM